MRDMEEKHANMIVAGRSCGDCTLCCKLMGIAELRKPRGVWCTHCKPDRGCLIYDSRPGECRDFNCGYLTISDLGEEWRPNKCRIVLNLKLEGNRIAAFVDPQRPDVWRREPYYSTLKKLAAKAVSEGGWLAASVGRHIYVIFPDRDVDLGDVGEDEMVVVGERRTLTGVRLEAHKLRHDDPKLIELARQHRKMASK